MIPYLILSAGFFKNKHNVIERLLHIFVALSYQLDINL